VASSSPAASSSAASAVSSALIAIADGAEVVGAPAQGRLLDQERLAQVLGAELQLEGLGGVVLEVLAQLKEARHADHGDPGEQREGDHEADPQPVCKRRVHQRPPAD
jgi:hypothetical protein